MLRIPLVGANLLHDIPHIKPRRAFSSANSVEVGNGSNKRGENRFNDTQIAGVNVRINAPDQVEFIIVNGEGVIMPSLGVYFLQEQQGAVNFLSKLVKVFRERTTIRLRRDPEANSNRHCNCLRRRTYLDVHPDSGEGRGSALLHRV